ncbi:Helix-turn-helix domain-containing protein [Nakamurella panacisegetis]|uniref:Helix-turn-helix domain-containing protein n=1 Tax=Nakamurella panacisegetis TaxID=1090615 RepID=A0A1H0R963_9ACTN|nr:helix-turn-helix transcriptional regulator [Nakamurella panacisegetis]SDP25586.1 Helix-turn-helix domain-containing protein [Nakamurella panacisegetis]
MDRGALSDFLRSRRQALQPEDVGISRGPRRRTAGLRREEVAALAQMSPDYYARLERGTGPQPSEQMAAAIARGLRLTLAERDHLFLLIGHGVERRVARGDHVSPGLMRVLDRLDDTPAQVMGAIGETLAQTRVARALFGDQTRFTGPARSAVYRWFTDPAERQVYVVDDHELHGRTYTSKLRQAVAESGPRSLAATMVAELKAGSPEFASLWADQEVGLSYSSEKRLEHHEVGRLDLYCQTLLDPDQGQTLLIFTATPGSESASKLALLSVVAASI